ncbi:MAG: type VII secretion protein EssC [Mycoplasmatales bacterium]
MDKYFFLKDNIIYEKKDSLDLKINKYFYNNDIKVGKGLDIDIDNTSLVIGKKVLVNNGEVYKNYKKVKDIVIDFEIGDNLIINQKIKIMYIEKKILDIKVFDQDTKVNLLKVNDISIEYEEYPEYTNSPRVKKKLPNEKISLETPPEKDKDITFGSLFKKLIPAIIGVVIALLMLKIRPRGIRGIIMFFSMLVSFSISMITLYEDRKANKKHNKQRKKVYIKYLQKKRKELTQLKNEQNETQKYNNLSQIDILDEVNRNTYRLYERDQLEEDFLTLKLGEVSKQASYDMTNPFEKIQLKYEELELNLKDLYEEYKDNEQSPILINFKKFNVGLIGSRFVINKQIHSILSQIYFNHSYLDLNVVVITGKDNVSNFEYLRWIKHFKNISTGFNNIIVDSVSRDQGLAAYEQILRQRVLEYDKGIMYKPHFLFIIENTKIMKSHPIMEYLQKDNIKYGFSLMYLVHEESELPDNVETIINFLNEKEAILKLNEGHFENLVFKLDEVEDDVKKLELVTRKIGELEHIKGVKSSIPSNLGFLEMYNVLTVKDLEISKRWDENKSYKSLRALLGKKSQVDEVYLDLHEKYHGPHGLIAGTTGSGKSEVIQTYILSLAINYSPEEVGFLLIDYKGGGMANLFKSMPHHLGSITNLDGYQSMRALASIKSELKRRQQIFSDNDVNHINGYHKLYEQNLVSEPLPHLFLISDEFAELKTEQPDFMKELVSAARIGRSLGIHLILATQKPSGVVDEQIWSNSKFKLSLKVAEESDSKELLRTPDAAYIVEPGRGYLKVGTNELYELFQSGYSGATYQKESTSKIDKRIFEIDVFGKGTLINEDVLVEEKEGKAEIAEEITELTATLEEISKVYEAKEYKKVPKPWLEPLSNIISMDQNINYTEKVNLTVDIGIIDLPHKQMQINYEINLLEGHMVIYGAQSMGKSMLMYTTILRLAMQNKSSLLKLFILDFGNSGLIQLKNLNHTAEYIKLEDSREHIKLISYVQEEIQIRKHILEEAMVSSYQTYNEKNPKKLEAFVIAIDNYENLVETPELSEMISLVAREGLALGIFLITTASKGNTIKQNVLNYIKNRVVLYISDKGEISSIIGKSQYPQQEVQGRGLIKNENVEVCQFKVPYSEESIDEIEHIRKVIHLINEYSKISNQGFVKMSESIEYKKHEFDGQLYLGNRYSDLKEHKIDLSSLLITGDIRSGKTNMLRNLLEQLRQTDSKITIIDDILNSLSEYSQYDNIDYVTNPALIDFEGTSIYIINKLSRFNKIKKKELEPIYEMLFKEVAGGKLFLVEESEIKGKIDLMQIFKTLPTLHLADISQDRAYTKNNLELKTDIFNIGDSYFILDKDIIKLKTAKVITGNENKNFNVEESNVEIAAPKGTVSRGKLELIEQVIVASKEEATPVVNKLKELADKINNKIIEINHPKEILATKDEILILDGNFLNELSSRDRKSVLEELDKRVDKQKMILITESKLKGNGDFAKKFKKPEVIVSFKDLDKQDIMKIKKSGFKEEKVPKNSVLIVHNGKEVRLVSL